MHPAAAVAAVAASTAVATAVAVAAAAVAVATAVAVAAATATTIAVAAALPTAAPLAAQCRRPRWLHVHRRQTLRLANKQHWTGGFYAGGRDSQTVQRRSDLPGVRHERLR